MFRAKDSHARPLSGSQGRYSGGVTCQVRVGTGVGSHGLRVLGYGGGGGVSMTTPTWYIHRHQSSRFWSRKYVSYKNSEASVNPEIN